MLFWKVEHLKTLSLSEMDPLLFLQYGMILVPKATAAGSSGTYVTIYL